MNKNTTFESKRLFYRGINENDTDLLVNWRADPSSVKYFKNTDLITIESHLKWFNGYLCDNTRIDFIFNIKESNKPIGTVTASSIDYNSKSCEIGYAVYDIGERGKGYAKEAVTALIEYIKSEFSINKFFAEIHKDNVPSLRLIKSLKFEKDQFEKYVLVEN